MQYGICTLNCVPVRKENNDTTEMVTQILFGDHFKVLEKQKKWSKIRIAYDSYEGWIDNKQYQLLSQEKYYTYSQIPDSFLVDLVDFAVSEDQQLTPLSVGANLKAAPWLNLHCEGQKVTQKIDKSKLIELASIYLNAPYLWGGKTAFGIDCSGLTQMVYKIAGYALLRDASQQVTQGEALSFIEESEPGDLAFFDNDEGDIIHVGIVMENNYIIHAHGKVRLDRLDHTGIFNVDTNRYSHKLRVIKKII
ncbi:MAG TPA: C40 family peptidase [Flavobacteriaceae bacterium]|nr:C40 family peptidase [Flavobacteriaceae bacterium]